MLAPQRYYFISLAVFLVLVSSSFFLYQQDEATLYDKIINVPYGSSSKHSLRNTILHLFDSIKHEPSNPTYRSPSGTTYTANSTTWTKPLGKNVLIVDIDTRVPTGENQILNPDTLDFESLDVHDGGLVSAAIINHYLYALIHGYDYKFYSAQHIPEHHDTWILPHVIRELIDDYAFVVVMDADVTVSHLDVPLEWLFNRWAIARHTSMALPWDTEELRNNASISTDSSGLRVLNTGFVVAQNNPLTREMLDAWRDCTTESRYPGCSRWKDNWSHEQRAFSEYIRHDEAFNRTPSTIVSIPCDDAVGWPGFKKDVEAGNQGISDCNGNFVRHYTLGKDKVKTAGSTGVMQVVAQVLQMSLLGEKGMWVKEEGTEQKGEEESGGGGNGEIVVPAILEGMVPVTT